MTAPRPTRRALLQGIGALPIAGTTAAAGVLAAVPAVAGSDPFPSYYREVVALIGALEGDLNDVEAAPMMDRWRDLDSLAMATKPTTCAGIAACLQYARREHVQFGMKGDEGEDDPGSRLILALLDNALGTLREMVNSDPNGRAA